ncbi:hypothetical protein RUM44_001782 [Polyplax serrata]|uniref:Uncharacterized protein n=1 Tax=Polyplax serrata TaxID=468196 RepID=A0ABR1AL20_POLSC
MCRREVDKRKLSEITKWMPGERDNWKEIRQACPGEGTKELVKDEHDDKFVRTQMARLRLDYNKRLQWHRLHTVSFIDPKNTIPGQSRIESVETRPPHKGEQSQVPETFVCSNQGEESGTQTNQKI